MNKRLKREPGSFYVNVVDDGSSEDEDFSLPNAKIHRTQDKREYHNGLERKRREVLRDAFEHFKDSIPDLRDSKGRVSRAQILKGGHKFIQTRLNEIAKAEKENKILKEEFQELQNKIQLREKLNSKKHTTYRPFWNESSSVSKKKPLVVSSNLSSRKSGHHSSAFSSSKPVNHSSVSINPRNNNTLRSFDAGDYTIYSNLTATEMASSFSSTTLNKNGPSSSGSKASPDFHRTDSAYSSSSSTNSSINDDFPSSLVCEAADDNQSVFHSDSEESVYDLRDVILDELVNSLACSPMSMKVEPEDNENYLNMEMDATLGSCFKGDFDDDNFSAGFDITSLKPSPVFDNIPNYEDSIDLSYFDENFLMLDHSDASQKVSMRFGK